MSRVLTCDAAAPADDVGDPALGPQPVQGVAGHSAVHGHEVHALHGLVLDEIVAEAREGDYDLVVVGTQPVQGWMRLLLNDVSQQIIGCTDRPVLVDKFLEDAFEVDVDALADGRDVVICGIMQHLEQAGIHSGDSVAVLPTWKVKACHLETIRRQTRALALEHGIAADPSFVQWLAGLRRAGHEICLHGLEHLGLFPRPRDALHPGADRDGHVPRRAAGDARGGGPPRRTTSRATRWNRGPAPTAPENRSMEPPAKSPAHTATV